MQHILRVTRISGKDSFKFLRSNAPYRCTSLYTTTYVTSALLKHISGYQKQRTDEEIILRLSMLPLIPKILHEGEIIQEKNGIEFEGKFFEKSYRIQLKIK